MKKSFGLMRLIVGVFPLISAIAIIILDPDLMGIGGAVLILIPLYVAFRTRFVGSILLILVGVAMTTVALYLIISSQEKEPWGSILGWLAISLSPLASGILFIIIDKAKNKGIKKG